MYIPVCARRFHTWPCARFSNWNLPPSSVSTSCDCGPTQLHQCSPDWCAREGVHHDSAYRVLPGATRFISGCVQALGGFGGPLPARPPNRRLNRKHKAKLDFAIGAVPYHPSCPLNGLSTGTNYTLNQSGKS